MTPPQTTEFQTQLTQLQDMLFPFMRLTPVQSETLSLASTAPMDLVFDDLGLLVSRSFDRDDGLRQEDSYEDGVRVATQFFDVADEFEWADVTNVYDETGRIRKETRFDDGMTRVDTFADGVRLRSVQTDSLELDLMDWITRDVTYDIDSTPLSRLTRYDDGTEVRETFQEGTRSKVAQEDLVLTGKFWNLIEAFYDTVGRLEARDMNFDDGILRSDSFSAGVRQKTQLEDAKDAFDWETIQYLYDPDGVVTSRQQVDDNGDLTLILFDDGLRDERIRVDVSGAEDWDVQITNYDAEGVTNVFDYADRGTVLDDYAPFFATDNLILV